MNHVNNVSNKNNTLYMQSHVLCNTFGCKFHEIINATIIFEAVDGCDFLLMFI